MFLIQDGEIHRRASVGRQLRSAQLILLLALDSSPSSHDVLLSEPRANNEPDSDTEILVRSTTYIGTL